MIEFLIKSTVCLVVLYGFFHIFLSNHKTLLFNRFYLMFSVVFSLIIPLIRIPIKSNISLITNSLDNLTFTTGHFIQQKEIVENATPLFTYQNILIVLVIIISSVLLIRFAFNIFKIIRKIIKCKKVDRLKISLVLVEEKTLPYSFFRYIFVNRSDFENGKIEKELLIHEETHCLQYHSIDVLILELVNIFLWFNPVIWLFRKAILLNHEYYADNKVLANNESFNYHQLLINLVIQNSTNYLVSGFKCSLIKNRLIMMTRSGTSNNVFLRKITAISLFLFLGIAFTFSQVNKLNSEAPNLMAKSLMQQDNNSGDWWKSIVEKHGINYESFTIHENFVIFGKKTIYNNLESFNDVVAISNDGYTYSIYKSKTASYDNKNRRLKINDCSIEKFDWNSRTTLPSLQMNINITVDFKKGWEIMADTLNPEKKLNINTLKFKNEWWYPILKKHNVEPSGFNNFEKVFEMGSTNSIKDRVVTLENAFILLRIDANEYGIIKSPLAYHDLDKNIIECDEGTIIYYEFNSVDINPRLKITFNKLTCQLNGFKPRIHIDQSRATYYPKK
jgi:beta-lactamase regulating signal transducer with metallopeptidase domain